MALFLSYQMMKGYLDPVIIAVILAVLSSPVYQWLKTNAKVEKKPQPYSPVFC